MKIPVEALVAGFDQLAGEAAAVSFAWCTLNHNSHNPNVLSSELSSGDLQFQPA